MARVLTLSALMLVGCANPPEGHFRCDTAADCPDGWYCHTSTESPTQALCYSTPGMDIDAGIERDAGPALDAATTDAGSTDAGLTDAGAVGDAGPTDGGASMDAGSPEDGGIVDPCSWGTFDGSSYVEVGGFSLADTAHTVEAWVRVDPATANRPIISIGRLTLTVIPNSGGGDLLVDYTAHNSLPAPSTSGLLGDGRWHHVGYTYRGGGYATASNWTYWIDGRAYPVAMFEGNASRNPLPTSGVTTIGREPTESTPAYRFMDGDMRELRISSGVRYSAEFVPEVDLADDATTLALWRLGDVASGTAPDSSGDGHDGISMGASATRGECPRSCRIELVHTESGLMAEKGDWADIDGDGDDDFAAGFDTNPARVYRNDGGSSLTSIWTEPGTGRCANIRWGHLDGGGDIDLAVGHCDGNSGGRLGYAYVFANTGGTLASTPAFTTETGLWVSGLAFADADGDGNNDLYVATSAHLGPPSRIYRGDGSAIAATPWWTDSTNYRTADVEFVDVDGDRDGDWVITAIPAAAGGVGPEGVHLLRNDSGSYTTAWSHTDGAQPRGFVLGDIDGDTDIDAVVFNDGGTLVSYDDVGALLSTSPVAIDTTTGVQILGLALGDVDDDGDLDLAAARTDGGAMIWRNDGSGSFTRVWTATETDAHDQAQFIDWDGDGVRDDLAVWNGASPLRIYSEVCR